MSIELKQLQFFYPTIPEKLVLNIDNWQLNLSQSCFLHADSGSGKSTLLNIISGLYLPSSGSVQVLGEALEKMSQRQRDQFRANNIGYVFQQFNLINYLDAVDNIQLANHFSNSVILKNARLRASELLEQLGIPSKDWVRPVHQLSVGQQQRIGIARALINKPKLLLADEPTSSLDENAKNNFMTLLHSICKQSETSLLFVSHDSSLKKHFNNIQPLNEINQSTGSI